jgi:hypothetical protein
MIMMDDHKSALLPVRRPGSSCAVIFTVAVIA